MRERETVGTSNEIRYATNDEINIAIVFSIKSIQSFPINFMLNQIFHEIDTCRMVSYYLESG